MSDRDKELIIMHSGGSFGLYFAKKTALSRHLGIFDPFFPRRIRRLMEWVLSMNYPVIRLQFKKVPPPLLRPREFVGAPSWSLSTDFTVRSVDMEEIEKNIQGVLWGRKNENYFFDITIKKTSFSHNITQYCNIVILFFFASR